MITIWSHKDSDGDEATLTETGIGTPGELAAITTSPDGVLLGREALASLARAAAELAGVDPEAPGMDPAEARSRAALAVWSGRRRGETEEWLRDATEDLAAYLIAGTWSA